MEDNIDIHAGIFIMLATRLDQVARKIGKRLGKIFATAAMVIGASPIPVSDVYILFALQALLIMVIAYLAGHDISVGNAKNLIMSLGGAGAAGLAFRALAQQAAKFLNLIAPGAGSVASAAVAGAGTYAMGEAAIRHFIDGASPAELRRTYEEARQGFEEGAT